MANSINVYGKMSPTIGTSDTEGGQTYTRDERDKNAGRSFGGKYPMTYTSADLALWESAVVSQSSASSALNGSGWTELADVTGGTIPTNIKAIAVEHVGLLGSPAAQFLKVRLGSVDFASLALNQSVVIPINDGWQASDVFIYASVYSNGSREITCNVLIAGT